MNKNTYKLSKYLIKYLSNFDDDKRRLYTNKINYYLIDGYDYTNNDDVLRYLSCLFNEKGSKLITYDQPYILIVYGSP